MNFVVKYTLIQQTHFRGVVVLTNYNKADYDLNVNGQKLQHNYL
jgi:hypothetical protein